MKTHSNLKTEVRVSHPRKEDELSRKETELHVALDNMPGALVYTDDELNIVFAYPWPDEERLVEQLFEDQARHGALLMTYHGERGLWMRRKEAP